MLAKKKKVNKKQAQDQTASIMKNSGAGWLVFKSATSYY